MSENHFVAQQTAKRESSVATWNTGFNEAAAACGLSAQDILELGSAATVIGQHYWNRAGDRISVAVMLDHGSANWAVDAADLRVAEAA